MSCCSFAVGCDESPLRMHLIKEINITKSEALELKKEPLS